MTSIIPFPDRGGTGFQCDPGAKWGDFDQTNLRFAAEAFWKKHGAGGYAVLGIKTSPGAEATADALQALMTEAQP